MTIIPQEEKIKEHDKRQLLIDSLMEEKFGSKKYIVLFEGTAPDGEESVLMFGRKATQEIALAAVLWGLRRVPAHSIPVIFQDLLTEKRKTK